jgi:drug/metabolite transporter (DMT)-like permease
VGTAAGSGLMDAIVLACCSAALFGAMTVVLRVGLRSGAAADAGTLATVVTALAVLALNAAVQGEWDLPAAWPFLVAGVLAPGCSQILFTAAIRDVGASRASVTIGTAPLFSVAIALVFLGEPVIAGVVVGAVLIVAGGALLLSEPRRPAQLRLAGYGFALTAAVIFATRDSLIRRLGTHAVHVDPGLAAFATVLSGAVALGAFMLVRRQPLALRTLPAFVPAGVLYGVSYALLFEAFYRGRVSVVSPFVATETIWAVGLSLLFLRQERVGGRLLLGAGLVVAGGVLIGIFR